MQITKPLISGIMLICFLSLIMPACKKSEPSSASKEEKPAAREKKPVDSTGKEMLVTSPDALENKERTAPDKGDPKSDLGKVQKEPPILTCSEDFGCTVENGITDEMVEKMAKEGNLSEKPLKLVKISDADLLKLTKIKDQITDLDIEGAPEITHVEPLALMVNLKTLMLFELPSLTDLSPLAKLTQLRTLHIHSVMYKSLDFLKPLNDLETLTFLAQPLEPSDISFLEGKAKLKVLRFHNMAVKDINPLKELTALEELSLAVTKVSDLSPLKGLKRLQRLNLSSIPATDLSPVGELADLQAINLFETRFSDYTPLAKLTKLRELILGISAFHDLSVIENMPELEVVELIREKIDNWEALRKVVKLRFLKVDGTSFTDLGLLADMHKLESLVLDNCTLSNVAMPKLAGLVTLRILKTRGIPDITIFKDLPSLRHIVFAKEDYPESQVNALKTANPNLTIWNQ